MRSVSQTTTKSTNLRQIPAILHLAPLAAPVSACIFKQPAAFFATTLSQARQVPSSQKLSSRKGYRPEHPIQRSFAADPFPRKPNRHVSQPFMSPCSQLFVIQDLQINLLRSSACHCC